MEEAKKTSRHNTGKIDQRQRPFMQLLQLTSVFIDLISFSLSNIYYRKYSKCEYISYPASVGQVWHADHIKEALIHGLIDYATLHLHSFYIKTTYLLGVFSCSNKTKKEDKSSSDSQISLLWLTRVPPLGYQTSSLTNQAPTNHEEVQAWPLLTVSTTVITVLCSREDAHIHHESVFSRFASHYLWCVARVTLQDI
jgi:hypothetical protein